ncbi:MAG: hypothetical protein ACTSRG_15020 [Candidatus Helarchaeota archaeon]
MVDEIKEILKDLILLNGIIAVEALQITENTSKIARKSDSIPEQCQISHDKLRTQIINILKKYLKEESKNLEEHIIKH